MWKKRTNEDQLMMKEDSLASYDQIERIKVEALIWLTLGGPGASWIPCQCCPWGHRPSFRRPCHLCRPFHLPCRPSSRHPSSCHRRRQLRNRLLSWKIHNLRRLHRCFQRCSVPRSHLYERKLVFRVASLFSILFASTGPRVGDWGHNAYRG